MGKYNIKNEPVMATSTLMPIIVVVLQLLASFGMDLTPEQTSAILALAGIFVPLLAGWYARGKVTPVHNTPSKDVQ